MTTDAFRLGGRETFITTHVEEFKERVSGTASLLSEVVSNPLADLIFDETCAVDGSEGYDIENWLRTGSAMILRRRPNLIWSQHFGLFPAWLLSVTHEIPFLPTFHGPIAGGGRPTTLLDAIGMAIVLRRTPIVTAVSDEVADELYPWLPSGATVRILPNRIAIPEPAVSHRLGATKIVLMSRREKLDHIRAAVEFTGKWRRRIGPVELTVHLGFDGNEASFNSNLIGRSSVVGRRWLSRTDRVLGLMNTRLMPPTAEPLKVAASADVVLGMGRALLEGIASRKPSVLVGYDKVVDLVDDANFEQFKRNNFSGRGYSPKNLDDVVDRAYLSLNNGKTISREKINGINIKYNWPKISSILDLAKASFKMSKEDKNLANKLISIHSDKRKRSFVQACIDTLSEDEAKVFYTIGGHLLTDPPDLQSIGRVQ